MKGGEGKEIPQPDVNGRSTRWRDISTNSKVRKMSWTRLELQLSAAPLGKSHL